VGNKYFREAVAAALDEYMQKENRFEKSFVVHRIVDEIRGRGGRFLKLDALSGEWREIPQQQAREKVGHAIRDAANLHLQKQQLKQVGAMTTASWAGVGSARNKPGVRLKSPPSTSYVGKKYGSTTTRKQLAKRQRKGSIASGSTLLSVGASPMSDGSSFKPSPIQLSHIQQGFAISSLASPYRLDSNNPGTEYPIQQLIQQQYQYSQPTYPLQQQQQLVGSGRINSSFLPSPGNESAIPPFFIEQPTFTGQQLQQVGQQSTFDPIMSNMSQQEMVSRQQQLMLPTMTAQTQLQQQSQFPNQHPNLLLQIGQQRPILYQPIGSQNILYRNDEFLDAINAVLGPMGPDNQLEELLIPQPSVDVDDSVVRQPSQSNIYQPHLEYQSEQQNVNYPSAQKPSGPVDMADEHKRSATSSFSANIDRSSNPDIKR
jgi:hypothetical protein